MFLAGKALTQELKRLAKTHQQKKIAISYWGKDALELLPLKSHETQILCCLKGGKSEPKVIKKFGKRAKQIDTLHAKVFWTRSAAIIGSANASSNGLPEEEDFAQGLIEAGVLIKDKPTLALIEKWFDRKWQKTGREILPQDLEAAAEARARRLAADARSPRTATNHIPELVDLPLSALKGARLGVLLWAYETTPAENREVKNTGAPETQLKNASWFLDDLKHARQYPCRHTHDYYTITFQTTCERKNPKYDRLFRFAPQKRWTTLDNGERVIFCEEVKVRDIPGLPRFKLGRRSKDTIIAALRQKDMHLKVDMDGGIERGYAAWEPLHVTLAGTRKR